jgi:murein DD-endopeptidase MepM/ murein hydrolase activator NlpD
MKKITDYEIRGRDVQGAGWFRAPREGRLHKGIDLVCEAREEVCAFLPGIVTKIGFPYSPDLHPDKAHLRYVQVDTDGNQLRYFYVNPRVKLGQRVGMNEVLGISQDLRQLYPGITQHFHFEIRDQRKKIVRPSDMFPGVKDGNPE